jgi:RNA polymerase subunit RPABC4/transcription elongation factor Spt4
VTEVDRRPLRNCYKCGRQIGPDQTICDVCNSAGMATPSATQYHGTIVVAIVAGVVIMAVAASLAVRGIGPFQGQALRWSADPPDGVVVQVQVGNQGTRTGRAKCELSALDASGRVLREVSSLSPAVSGGGSVTFQERMPGVPEAPVSIAVTCR